VFEITPSGALTTLYSFCALGYPCADGDAPAAGLIQGADGDFFGTTSAGGGIYNGGTIFKITAGGTFTTLHTFCTAGPPCTDGREPSSGLVQGADGDLYGTTLYGGAYSDHRAGGGTIFKISPGGLLTTLYTFCNQSVCPDGASVDALILATDGNFYG
jgi:uncharacterized repeat protein (TIGR03803 family)